MKKAAIVLAIVGLIVLVLASVDFRGLGQHQHSYQELAKGCRVSREAFMKAHERAKSEGQKPILIGRCTLSKTKDGRVALEVNESERVEH